MQERKVKTIRDMTQSVILTFLSGDWLPFSRDGFDYRLFFRMAFSDSTEGTESTDHHQGHIVVGISRSLTTTWNLISQDDIEKVLFEYGKRQIADLIREGTIPTSYELQLTTYSEPDDCPINIEDTIIEYDSPILLQLPGQHAVLASESKNLAANIIGLRDSINSLFGERHKSRLLALPQERHLLELFYECNTREEFAFRCTSIAGLATAIDKQSISNLLLSDGITIDSNAGSIEVLAQYLRSNSSEQEREINSVLDTIANLNRIRRMYPTHTDRAKGFHSSLAFFCIDYPVSDYQGSWITLLEHYRDALETLLDLLKS